MEICRALDLDWQDVIEQPELDESQLDSAPATSIEPSTHPTESQTASLLTAAQGQAAIARDALTPRILQRIPRQVVRQVYLPAIARGVGGLKRLIATRRDRPDARVLAIEKETICLAIAQCLFNVSRESISASI